MYKSLSFSSPEDPEKSKKLLIQQILSIPLLLLCTLLLFMKLSLSSAFSSIRILQTRENIKKPLTDFRDYEIISLSNDLVITLISDANTTRSGFSMTTLLGSNNNKIKYPGIGKLLETKMISQKLLNIIKKNVGEYKLETNEETSSFYFDINSEGFIDALEELGNILKNPFDYYDKSNQSDVELINDLKKIYENEIDKQFLINYLLSPDSNQYQKIFTNNDEEMKEKANDMIANMKELFNVFFSPQNIKIAIISNYPLSKLKTLSNRIFNSLSKKEGSASYSIYNSLLEEQIQFKQFIWSKPKNPSEERVLTLYLYSNEYKFQGLSMLSYFQYILEGERPDSVFYYLGNENKFIENAEINIKKSIRFGNYLEIKTKLTKEGIAYIDYVIKVVFGLIQSIKLKIKTRQTYNNVMEIYNKKFQYLTIDKYSSYLNEISFNMLNITKEMTKEDYANILYMSYNLEPFEVNQLFSMRDYLGINHTAILFQSEKSYSEQSFIMKDIFGNQDLDGKVLRKNFGFQYLTGELHEHKFSEQISDFAKEYKGKEPNIYLTRLSTLSPVEEGEIQSVIDDSKMKLWIKKDTTFQVPRIHSYFHLVFPDIRNTDREIYNLCMVYVNYIEKDILMSFDEAKLSGNEIKANIDENGLNIKVVAYKDVYMPIIYKIFSLIIDVDKISLSKDYDYLSKRYRNLEEKSLNYLGMALKPQVHSIEDDEEESISQYNYDQMMDFFEYCSLNLYMESLVYGDVDEEITKEIKALLSSINTSGNSTGIEEKFPNKNGMKEILEFLSYNTIIEKANLHIYKLYHNFAGEEQHYFISFYQIGERNDQLDVLTSMLCELFNEKNKEMEGTIEKVFKDNIIYLRVMMKSYTLTPLNMSQIFEEKVEKFISNVNDLTKEDFEMLFNYIKNDYFKKDTRLRYKAVKYWYEIYERTFNFKRYENIQDLIKEVKLSGYYKIFKDFCVEHLWNNARLVELWLYEENYMGNVEDESYDRKVKAKIFNYDSLVNINNKK